MNIVPSLYNHFTGKNLPELKRRLKKLGTGEFDDVRWDDLRVSANATTSIGSNPPVESLLTNDGDEVGGDVNALSFISQSVGNLTIADSSVYDWTTGDATLEFWYRPNAGTQNFTPIAVKSGLFEILYRSSGRLALSFSAYGFDQTTLQVNIGSWNHIAMVHTPATKTAILYINGVQAGSTSSGGTAVGNTASLVFNGEETLMDLDQIAIWSKALSSAEVAASYDSGAGVALVGTETDLEGLWALNGDSTDTHVTGNDAVITGTEDTDFEWIDGHIGTPSTSSRGVILKFFSPTVENEVYFEIQFPHARKLDSELRPHVHWTPAANGGEDESVVWGLEYTWASFAEVFSNTTIIKTDAPIPNEDLIKGKHYISNFPAISGEGKELSSMMVCRLFRDVSNANDTFNDFAGLLEFDIHFQIDSTGSRQEYIK